MNSIKEWIKNELNFEFKLCFYRINVKFLSVLSNLLWNVFCVDEIFSEKKNLLFFLF